MDFEANERFGALVNDILDRDQTVSSQSRHAASSSSSSSTVYSTQADGTVSLIPVNEAGSRALKLTGAARIPAQIKEVMKDSGDESAKGLFPEILRAFCCVGNKLFLWRYSSFAVDVNVWTAGEAEVIYSVALVHAKPSEFAQSPYLIAVATNCTLYLLEFWFQQDDVNQRMTIEKSRFFVDVGQLRFTHIISTEDGRIFAGSDSGDVYLIEYGQSWFRPIKCRRINSDGSYLYDFLRIIPIPWLYSDPIVELAIAHRSEGHFLLRLTQNNVISLFKIEGNSLVFVNSIDNVFEKATECLSVSDADMQSQESSFLPTRLWNSMGESRATGIHQLFAHDAGIRSITPLHSWQSDRFILSALTENGTMLNFQLSQDQELCLTDVSLYCIKTDPNEHISVSDDIQVPASVTNVYLGFKHELVTLIANVTEAHDGCSDDLIVSYPSFKSPSNVAIEKHRVNSIIRDVKEDLLSYDESSLAATFRVSEHALPLEGLSWRAIQHLRTRRTFICLTDDEVLQYEMEYPIDNLLSLISTNDSTEPAYEFLSEFPATDSCCMCLILLCGANESLDHRKIKHQFKSARPGFGDPLYSGMFASKDDFVTKVQVSSKGLFWRTGIRNELRKSPVDGVEKGLMNFFATIMRPLWRKRVLDIECFVSQSRTFSVSLHTVQNIIGILFRLLRFLEEDDMKYYLRGDAFKQTVSDTFRDTYLSSIHTVKQLYRVLRFTIPLLQILVALGVQPSPPKIIAKLPDASRNLFRRSSISQLCLDVHRVELGRSLIQAIVEFNPHPDHLTWLEDLRRLSPELVTAEDLESRLNQSSSPFSSVEGGIPKRRGEKRFPSVL